MPLYFLLYSQWFCSFWAGLCVEHLVKKKKIFNKLKFTVFNQILKAKQNSNQKSVSFFLHIFPLQLKKRYQIACQKKNKQFQIIFIYEFLFSLPFPSISPDIYLLNSHILFIGTVAMIVISYPSSISSDAMINFITPPVLLCVRTSSQNILFKKLYITVKILIRVLSVFFFLFLFFQ